MNEIISRYDPYDTVDDTMLQATQATGVKRKATDAPLKRRKTAKTSEVGVEGSFNSGDGWILAKAKKEIELLDEELRKAEELVEKLKKKKHQTSVTLQIISEWTKQREEELDCR